jgi:tripartite-type tricarboxylate transporter receptor subunit TctC
MNPLPRKIATALSCLLLSCLGASQALAAEVNYPTAPITLIVPTGAGGGTDLAARSFSEKLSSILGQPVVVDNRAGAGGIIGTQEAARAKPDGHTLLISSNQFAILPAVQKKLPYDPIKDFIPVTSIGLIPTLVLVNPALPVKSVEDLIKRAKKEHGELQYASAGIGSPNHLFAAMFASMAKVPMLHVPFRGTSPALVAVAGGQTDLAFASQPASQSFVAAGKLRPIAVTSAQRLHSLPDLPPVSDTVPGYDADIWLGVWAVKGTPAPIVDKIHAALAEALKDEKVVASLKNMGLVVNVRSQQAFSKMVEDEIAKWVKVVDNSGGEISKQ